jgi:hypothetical protein
MPQLKQPTRLEEMGIRLHINKYCGKCKEWMEELVDAMKIDYLAYELVVRSIFNECREMGDEISNLPPGILKLLSYRLAKQTARLICNYDYNFDTLPCSFWEVRRNISVCKAVFRSVLTRFVERFDKSLVRNRQVQVLMVQNLKSVPGLLELWLYPYFKDESQLLANMIHHLKNLQIFTYQTHSTDEIIAQLQWHCPHLTELDIAYSSRVTNASVQYLRKVRKLKFLNLEGTQIDGEHYAMILSELPNIANITFHRYASCFLHHIAVERLDTITHVGCYIGASDRISMDRVARDLSGLTGFNALRALTIHGLDYGRSNWKAVLQGVGHRLTDLKLSLIRGVALQDIVTLCPSLANLSLNCCSDLNLNSYTYFDPKLPHFRNLITLELGYLEGSPNVCTLFRYYVSLKTIQCTDTDSYTVRIFRYSVEQSTRHDIKVDAVKFMTPHSPFLKGIELVGSISNDRDVFRKIKRQIVLQDFDLKLKEDYALFFLNLSLHND